MSQQRMCPVLTASVIRKPESSKILPLSGEKPAEPNGFDAVPCAGPMCALFVPVMKDGRAIGGDCAIALFPTAIAMLNGTVRDASGLNAAAPKATS